MTTIIYDREAEYDTNPAIAEVVSTLPVAQALLVLVQTEQGTCHQVAISEAQTAAAWTCNRAIGHLPPHVAIRHDEFVLMVWID